MTQHHTRQPEYHRHDEQRQPHPDGPDRQPHRDDDELVTIAEAALILRTPVATLRYWRHQHTGPRSFRPGRKILYYRRDLHRWLRGHSDGNGHGQPT